MTMTCGAQVVDTRPAVVCEWSEPPGGASSFVCLEPAQLDPVQLAAGGSWQARATWLSGSGGS